MAFFCDAVPNIFTCAINGNFFTEWQINFYITTINFFGIMYNIFMKKLEQVEKITDKKFQRIFSVKRNAFFVMLDKLNQQFI